MRSGRKPAFCIGCEFAGSIPGGSPLDRTFTSKRGDVQAIVFMDEQARLSKEIVHPKDIEKAPASDTISILIADCEGSCALETNGFLPLDLSRQQKELIITKHLNSLAGVKELGGVSLNTQPQE